MLERRSRHRKASSPTPGRSGERIFFSRVNFLGRPLLGVHSTPILPQWHVKDPVHSAKSAGGRLHLNTHTSLTQLSLSGLTTLSRHTTGTSQRNQLTRNSSGIARPQSSQLAEPMWTDPGLKNGVHKLISTHHPTPPLHQKNK